MGMVFLDAALRGVYEIIGLDGGCTDRSVLCHQGQSRLPECRGLDARPLVAQRKSNRRVRSSPARRLGCVAKGPETIRALVAGPIQAKSKAAPATGSCLS